MIITKDQVKDILRITDSDLDDEISLYIPYVQDDLCAYLSNYFESGLITYQASTIAFVKGDPDTITDSDSKFVLEGFAAGDDVAIEYAYDNTGLHSLSTVAAGTLTLTSSNNLVSMSPSDTNHPIGSVKISRVNWPQELRLVAAKMVYFLIDNPRPDDVQAETQDGVTLSYAGNNPYPLRVLRMAEKHRMVRVV